MLFILFFCQSILHVYSFWKTHAMKRKIEQNVYGLIGTIAVDKHRLVEVRQYWLKTKYPVSFLTELLYMYINYNVVIKFETTELKIVT